jgi:hypothetical protein
MAGASPRRPDGKVTVWAAAAGVALAAASCAAESEGPASPGPSHWAGQVSVLGPGDGGPRPLAARTSPEWRDLWTSLRQDFPQPLPPGRMAVGVVGTPSGTCGCTVEILGLRAARQGGIELRYREACPPPTCMLFVPSSAYAVILTDSVRGPLTLVDAGDRGG